MIEDARKLELPATRDARQPPQPTRRRHFAPLQLLLCALLLAAPVQAFAESAEVAEVVEVAEDADWPKPTMQSAFNAMVYLLPRSIDPNRFSDPAERAGIMAQIDALAKASGSLESHGRESDVSIRFLSLSFAQDVEEIRMRYEAGRYDEARYFLIGSVQNCVACHSRHPTEIEFPLSEQLTEAVEMEKLSPHERALLYVITRRFAKALDTWEGFFKDPSIRPSQLDVHGVFLDYLSIAVRGMGEYSRARNTLEPISKREGLPVYLQNVLEDWIASLTWLEAQPKSPVTIEKVREVDARSLKMSEWPGDRHGMVLDLAASRMLDELAREANRQMEKGDFPNPAQLSEVYYRLGQIESRSLAGFWVDESPNYLEAAVRADPKGRYARKAFALLERDTIMGYGGAGEEHMPTEVWVRIESLRQLMDSQDDAIDPDPELEVMESDAQ